MRVSGDPIVCVIQDMVIVELLVATIRVCAT